MNKLLQSIALFTGLVLSAVACAAPEMVCIPGKDYEIGKYEVTQKEWRDIMGSNPSKFTACGDSCPVENVSWNDVQEFIQKLNAKTGKQYRLPTSMEWLYACGNGNGNGDGRTKYCGGNEEDAVAWTSRNSSWTTHPVGQKQPNSYGIYDMSGNVAEWLPEWDYSYVKYDGFRKVYGASYFKNNLLDYFEPHIRADFVGFRLARSLDSSCSVEPAKPKENPEMQKACQCAYGGCADLSGLLTRECKRDEEFCRGIKQAKSERIDLIAQATKAARKKQAKVCDAWKAAGPEAKSDEFKRKLQQQEEAIAAAKQRAEAAYDRKFDQLDAAEKQRAAAKGNDQKAAQQARDQAAQEERAKRDAANNAAAAKKSQDEANRRQWCFADKSRLGLCECAEFAPPGPKSCGR